MATVTAMVALPPAMTTVRPMDAQNSGSTRTAAKESNDPNATRFS